MKREKKTGVVRCARVSAGSCCGGKMMENMPCPVYCKGADGRYQECNQAFLRYLGKTRDEVIGRTPYDLFSAEEAEHFVEMDRELLQNKLVQTFEAPLHCCGDTCRQMIFQKAPCYDENGVITGIVGIVADISERKKNELMQEHAKKELEEEVQRRTQALRQSEEKFAKAFQYCTDVIGIVGLAEQGLLEINEVFCKKFGYEKSEIIGKSSREIVLWADQNERNLCYERLACGEEIDNIEAAWLTKQGRRLIGLYSSRMITLGEERCILFIWHDITQRKDAELALKSSHLELEHRIAARTQELLQKIKELTQTQEQLILQEKMAGIGQLAAGVAHELNNPLGFISSNFQVLRDYLDVLLDLLARYRSLPETAEFEKIRQIRESEEKHKLKNILDDVGDLCSETMDGLKRMSEIVTALRSFSRANWNEQMDDYDLNEGVRTTLLIARNEIKYVADVSLQLEDIPHVPAMGSQINQVILNILVNAAQAIKAGGQERGLIILKTDCDGSYVRCAITNNGPPIAAEIRSRIFEPFFTTKPMGQGTGIGLSLSYDIIVNKHKGRMSFTSTIEEGTTFFLELPLKEGSDRTAALQDIIR